MSFDFKNKVVLITGASGNLGSVLALEFALAQAKIVLASRNVNSLVHLTSKLDAIKAPYVCVELDVKSYDSCERAIDLVIEQFGTVDVVVNNASDCLEGWDLSRMLLENIDAEIHTTYRSVIYTTKAVLPHFFEKQQGVIANVSSISGVSEGSCPIYSADKAAVIRFTETMQPHLSANNIKMTCVVPPNIRFDNLVEQKAVSFKDVAFAIMMQCVSGDNLAMPVVHLKPTHINDGASS